MSESTFQMQKELEKSPPSTDKSENESGKSTEDRLAGATADVGKAETSGATGGGDNLEDLFSTLKQQISTSDWLKENTADKWVTENPKLAKEYMEAAKGTK